MKEDVLKNCLLILDSADYDIEPIEEQDIISLFRLNRGCETFKFTTASRNSDKSIKVICGDSCDCGVCSKNHYITIHELIKTYMKMEKEMSTDETRIFLNRIIEDWENYENPSLTKSISLCYIKAWKAKLGNDDEN